MKPFFSFLYILVVLLFYGFAHAQLEVGDVVRDSSDVSYRVVSFLGEGNWSKVYRAEVLSPVSEMPRDVALRFLKPGRNRDLSNDGSLVTITRHAKFLNQVYKLTDYSRNFESEGQMMVLERGGVPLVNMIEKSVVATGQSAREIRERVELIFRILQDVVAGLTELHKRGFVHLDVKDLNIIEVNGRYKLIDFDLMARNEHRARNPGTPGLSSPEQNRLNQVSYISDFYSLGHLAFRLMTGTYVMFEYNQRHMPEAHSARLNSIYELHHDEMVEFAKKFLRTMITSLAPTASAQSIGELTSLSELVVAMLQSDMATRASEIQRVASRYEKSNGKNRLFQLLTKQQFLSGGTRVCHAIFASL